MHSSSGTRSLSSTETPPERQTTTSSLSSQTTAQSRQSVQPSQAETSPPQLIRMEDLQNILSGMGGIAEAISMLIVQFLPCENYILLPYGDN